MFTTEYVEDFYTFFSDYKEHIEKHYQDFANTFNSSRAIDIDQQLFQNLIDSGYCNIFVLKEEEEFIGYISITVSPSVLFKGTLDTVIDHLYIVEEHRGKGYSSKVLKEVELQLKEEGIGNISLALPSLDMFASKQGYTKQSCIYNKDLEKQ